MLFRSNNFLRNPTSNLWFIGLDLDVNLAKTLDLTSEITQFMTQVQNQQTAARRYNDQMKVSVSSSFQYCELQIEVKYVAQKDIKCYLEKNDFLKGRRYVKRKPALSRTASEAEASPLPASFSLYLLKVYVPGCSGCKEQ